MRDELRTTIGFKQENWITAAQFCVRNKINLEEALTWVDMSVSNPFIGVENFTTHANQVHDFASAGPRDRSECGNGKSD